MIRSSDRSKSEFGENIPRKILKILISLLFLAVAAVAAVFAIKIFMPKPTPELVQPNSEVEAASQLQSRPGMIPVDSARVRPYDGSASFYGVAPISRPSSANTTRYGVIGIGRGRSSSRR